MFFNNCSGCLQVPVPVQYLSPYMTPVKKSSFHIADILRHHMTNSIPQICQDVSRKRTDVKYDDVSPRLKRSEIKRSRELDCMTKLRRSPTETDIVKTSKERSSVRCSLPSALAPLQALCSDGVTAFNDRSRDAEKSHSERTNSNSSLKFGINRILSEDFGKEKTEKENDGCLRDRICDCSDYRHMTYPTYALSAVHAIQPPRYPSSSPDSDILPGPYSVLNTEVNGGGHSKRKRSWSRAVFSNLQRKGLEKRFEVQKYVTKPDRRQLAAMLGLTDAQVKVWFQNRRMKWRHTSQQQQQQTDEEKDTSNDSRDDEMDTNDTVTDREEKLEIDIS